MKIAITQPCFFPYEGYFNMVRGVDKVLFLDDIFFNSKDWINKTILNVNDKDYYFRIPLEKTEEPKLIRDTEFINASWKKKFIKILNFNYKFKKNYSEVVPIIKEVLKVETTNISQLSSYSVFRVSEYLNIVPRHGFSFSSTLYNHINTNYADKIIQICKKEKATEFLSLPYLKDIFNPKDFSDQGVRLSFVNSNYPKYSIIDKIMDA